MKSETVTATARQLTLTIELKEEALRIIEETAQKDRKTLEEFTRQHLSEFLSVCAYEGGQATHDRCEEELQDLFFERQMIRVTAKGELVPAN